MNFDHTDQLLSAQTEYSKEILKDAATTVSSQKGLNLHPLSGKVVRFVLREKACFVGMNMRTHKLTSIQIFVHIYFER